MNNLNDVEEEEDWSFPVGETYALLVGMSDYKILDKEVIGVCNRCNIYEEIDETKLIVNEQTAKDILITTITELFCTECKELYDIFKIFRLNKSKELMFWNDGYWLEWYIKKLCEDSFPSSLIEQGTIVIKNGLETEIDVLLYKKGKIYGIECKAINPTKKAKVSDVADVLNYADLVDVSILVVSSTLDNKARSLLDDNGVIIVETNQIEDIGKLLKTK